MRFELDICFDYKLIRKIDLCAIYSEFSKFEELHFIYRNKTRKWNRNRFLKFLNEYENEYSLSSLGEGGSFFSIGSLYSNENTICVTVVQDIKHLDDIKDSLEGISKKYSSIVSAFLTYYEYTRIQSDSSEANINTFNYSDQLLESISKVVQGDGVWGKEYDVRFNPGRKFMSNRTWLIAGWKIWLGESFFRKINKELVLGFKHAHKIKVLDNNMIFIQLFEKIEESFRLENRFVQWKWQELIDYENFQ